MSRERPESKTANYKSHEEWEALNMILELPLLPITILGDLINELFDL